jgi:hypothetical protein
MQPLLPMLVRDQWFDTAPTRPARALPRRSETVRVTELRPRVAPRPLTRTGALPVLIAGA